MVTPAVSRRTVTTGGAAALAAVAGCGRLGAKVGAAEDPDLELARRAWGDEVTQQELLEEVRRRFRRLRRPLGDAVAMHREHARLLAEAGGAKGTTATLYQQPRTAAEALRFVQRGEQQLVERQTRRAMAAQSGPFARVLASMAAGAAQQGQVLAAVPVDRPGPRPSR